MAINMVYLAGDIILYSANAESTAAKAAVTLGWDIFHKFRLCLMSRIGSFSPYQLGSLNQCPFDPMSTLP